MLLVIHQEYHLFQFWLTIDKKKNHTNKTKFHGCAYSDPLARAVEILGADPETSGRGDCSVQKHKQEE